MIHSVLIIDDSEKERNEIKNVLEGTGLFNAFYEASDGLKGFKIMLSNPPDLILCDLIMPNFDGFKFLRLKRARQDYDNIPVLMVTGRDDMKDKIRGLEEGAQDYVLKPFNPLELVARVKAHLRIKLLQDELKQVNEKLETLSNTDPLTGLYNRRYFFNILEREFERSKRYNRALSLLMVDIDFFKSVNDRCGHLIGDKVLAVVARILKTDLRKIDSCARYGGEEFVILLPETEINGAESVGNRYLTEIREQDLSDICKEIKTITVSVGIVCLPDDTIKTTDVFLKYADDALYAAKKAGRNKLIVCNKP